MIEYINKQLENWAIWTMSGHTRLGLPSESAFMKMLRVPGTAAVISDEAAMDIERAVAALKAKAPDQHQVVDLFYLKMRTASAEVIANRLRCSRDTVYARLHRAHLSIMESLQDLEIRRKKSWRAQVGPGNWEC